MQKTLINAYQSSSNIIKHIYLENDKLYKEDVKFKPFLGTHTTDSSAWSDMYGRPVRIKHFDSISEMRAWKKEYSPMMDILGDVNPVIQFIATTYKDDIKFSKKGMKIFNFDIEVHADKFPKPDEALYPINAITINEMISDIYYTFAYCDYTPQDPKQKFIKCKDEKDLLTKFLSFWSKSDPQIITGWNVAFFDIPYIVNRIKSVLSDEAVKHLSTDRIIKASDQTDSAGNKTVTYTLQGHIIWDYMDLYKKYTQEKRESYSLDNISQVELGEEKIKYHDDYDNLFDLYNNDSDKFIRYNIQDVNLIKQLDSKLAYIDLAMTIMHKAKCQPEQIYNTVGPWDCIMYNELLARNILCPPNKNHSRQDFVGGYVAEPIKGLHEWLKVYDIVSSYPNQIISGNFSNETIYPEVMLSQELIDIKVKYGAIEKCIDINKLSEISAILQKHKVSFSSNGYFYDISKEGILPSIYSKLFKLRKEYKKQLKEYKSKGMEQEARIADLFQYTMKILLNSGYGFLSNEHSRYFDIRIAEAITSNGQVCARGAAKAITDKFKDVSVVYGDTDSVEKNSKITINNVTNSIEWFFENIDGSFINNNDKEYLIVDNCYSPCYTNKIENKKVKAIYRHKVSKEKWKLTTETGKEIFVTGDHSIMVLRDNILQEIKPRDIISTDKVITIQN